MKIFIVFPLLLFVFTINSNAYGQTPVASTEAQENNAVKPPRHAVSVAHDSPMSTPKRYFVEAAGGVAGAFGGGLVGGLISIPLVMSMDADAPGMAQLGVVASCMGVGIAVGMPAGVYIGGEVAGTDGSLIATYLGALAGVAGGGAVVFISATLLSESNAGKSSLNEIAKVSLLLPLIGAVVGYELSVDDPDETVIGTLSAPRPMISISPDGDRGYAGLRWTF